MRQLPLLLGLALCLGACASSRARIGLATLGGVQIPARPIQVDVETRNCTTRLLGLIPLRGLGRATPEATLRRTLTQFPDGNAVADASLGEDYRSWAGLVDRHCWTLRGNVAVVE